MQLLWIGWAMFLLLAHPLSAQVTAERQSPLRPLISDSFVKDTRGDFDIKGDVTWETDRIVLSRGATVKRKVEAGAWFEVELALEFPRLMKDGQMARWLKQRCDSN